MTLQSSSVKERYIMEKECNRKIEEHEEDTLLKKRYHEQYLYLKNLIKEYGIAQVIIQDENNSLCYQIGYKSQVKSIFINLNIKTNGIPQKYGGFNTTPEPEIYVESMNKILKELNM
jgi:hypothetical protein